MEEVPSDVEVHVKEVSSKGIIMRDREEITEKGEEIKTTEYFLDVGDQVEGDEVEEAQFVTVQTDHDTQFVAVEVNDSGQLILPEKEVILWNEICRVCANTGSDKEFIPIFSGEGVEHELSNKIHTYLPVRVSENDTLPLQVCYNCAATLVAWDEIFRSCVDAQQRLVELQSKLNLKEQYYNDSTVEEENMETVLEVETANQEQPQVESKEIETLETLQIVESNRCRSSETPKIATSDKQKIKPKLINKKKSLKSFSATNEHLTTMQETENLEKEISKEFVEYTNSVVCEKEYDIDKELDITSTWRETSTTKSNDLSKSVDLLEKEIVIALANEADSPEFEGSEDIEEHVDHSSENSEDDEPERPSSEIEKIKKQLTYTCDDCGKIFKFKDTYCRHRRIHSDERPYTCHVCGKRFRDSGGLCRHVRDVHAKLKNWPCSTCHRSFASKATRDDHERTHTGERPFVCDSCGKSFKTKASLYIHAKIHTDLFPHPCMHCDKGFRRRQELLAHVTTHTGEKNFECNVCYKSFRVKIELRRHALRHSDDKPFTCGLCDFKCKQRRYLNNHMKHKHSLIEKSQPSEPVN